MITQGSGVILTLTATPSRLAAQFVGGMAPAWSAVEALTRILAAELGPRGIRVVCLRPDAIPETETIDAVFSQHAKAHGIGYDDFLGIATRATVRKTLPTLAEVASVAAFLASNQASAITGDGRESKRRVNRRLRTRPTDASVGILNVNPRPADACLAIEGDPVSIIVTARGTLRAGDPELPKEGHNEIFARSLEQTQGLGLIGHRVFGDLRDPRSFLLVEQWTSPEGASQFFGDPQVQEAIGRLFEEPSDVTFWALRDGWTGLGRLDAPEIADR